MKKIKAHAAPDDDQDRIFKHLVDQWFDRCDKLVPRILSYVAGRTDGRDLIGLTVIVSARTDDPNFKAMVADTDGCSCAECEAAAIDRVAFAFAARRKAALGSGNSGAIH